jgi:hypothetical protein
MIRIPAIGISISTGTSECDAQGSEPDTPGNDDIRRSSGRAVEPLCSSGIGPGIPIPQRNPLRTGRGGFIAVRILDRGSTNEAAGQMGQMRKIAWLASEWPFQLRVAALTSYAPAPNLMA